MKAMLKYGMLTLVALVLAGCASSGVQSGVRLPPPDVMNPVYLRYSEFGTNKVFVVAVDPDGHWAFGYDHSRDSIEEAAINAAVKCDIAREKFGVHAKGRLFAVNDEIVYFNP